MNSNSNKKRKQELHTQNNNLSSFDVNEMNISLVQKIKEGEIEDISSLPTYSPHEEW